MPCVQADVAIVAIVPPQSIKTQMYLPMGMPRSTEPAGPAATTLKSTEILADPGVERAVLFSSAGSVAARAGKEWVCSRKHVPGGQNNFGDSTIRIETT